MAPRSGMRALYLHPGMNLESADYPYMPMGAVGLVNLVAGLPGWDVRGINVALERSLDPHLDVAGSLAEWGVVDWVLIDLHWYMSTAGALDLARLARKLFPAAHITLGGLTASYFAEELLSIVDEVDSVVRGDAEDAVLALASCLSTRSRDLGRVPNLVHRAAGGTVVATERVTTSELRFQALDYVTISWLDHWRQYYKIDLDGHDPDIPPTYWLEIGRGCFFNCGMCGGGLRAHRTNSQLARPRFRDPEVIAADLGRLHALGVEQVALSHDILGLNYPGLARLVALVRDAGIDMGLYHELWRIPKPGITAAVFEVFDPRRSLVALSPESGNTEVRTRNFPNKRFSNSAYLRYMDSLARHGTAAEVFFAANLPWETTETWQESIDLMRAIVSMFGPRRLTAYAGYLTLDPLSPMWERPDDYDIIKEIESLRDYESMTRAGRRRPGYRSKHLDAAGLVANLHRFRDAMLELRCSLAPA